jgi:hypothetical protein
MIVLIQKISIGKKEQLEHKRINAELCSQERLWNFPSRDLHLVIMSLKTMQYAKNIFINEA